MLIGGVIHYQVDQHPQSALFAALGKLHEIPQRTVARIHSVVICDIVAVISAGRWLKRHQPNSCHAEALEIVQPAHETTEVANAVAVGIQVGTDRQAVNDGVFVP